MIPLLNRSANLSGGAPFNRNQWGIILAGGDGVRLRPLVRKITGDERPKQFCSIMGPETLLDQTRRRVALNISPDRTFLVVTQPHEAFYYPLLRRVRSNLLLVQPENRGTSPAILYGLLRIAAMAPMDAIARFPSDHYVSDDEAFMDHIEIAFEAVRARPELIVLLGIAPEAPEVEYGWIEPGARLSIGDGSPFYQVRRFWEKPPLPLAETLLKRGCFLEQLCDGGVRVHVSYVDQKNSTGFLLFFCRPPVYF